MNSQLSPEQAADMPALFIVGAPRCGTTSLAGALAQHPLLAFSKPKEPHFFTALTDPINPAAIRGGYLSRFFPNLTKTHRALAEGSVSTIYDPAAVKRVLACFPNAVFVAMVRNPLDMLPSYHGRVLFLLDENEADFGRAWRLQFDRAKGRKLPRECRDPNLLRYADIGRMGAALQSLFAAAGRERCHVIVYDDYAREGARIVREVLERVGLDAGALDTVRRRNVNRTYRYRWLQRLLRRPAKPVATAMLKAKKEKEKGRATGIKREPNRMVRAVNKLKRWNTIAAPRQPLPPDLRAELVASFRDDVALLSQLLGRDLTPWLEGRPVPPVAVEPAVSTSTGPA